jgi:hypothetical protein
LKGDGCRSQMLHGADELTLPEFGLSCLVIDVYRAPPRLSARAHGDALGRAS